MEVNGVISKPYHTTKKGAMLGAGIGLAALGCQYGMVNANYSGLKGAAYAVKKERLELLKSIYESTGLFDMAKTTVSKVVKGAKKQVLSVPNVAKQVVGLAAIGAGIGFAVDLYKSHRAKVNSDKSKAV